MNESHRRPLNTGDIYPAHILGDEYGMNAENCPCFRVNAYEVPDSLRHLISYVERWAIPCDVTRHDYFDKQPDEDIADFYNMVQPFTHQIHGWLDEQPEDIGDWPEAAVHYMYVLKAHAEAYQPSEEEIREGEERYSTREHQRKLKAAVTCAEDAFRSKDYDRVVSLLSPFDGELEKVIAAKLALARKKAITQ